MPSNELTTKQCIELKNFIKNSLTKSPEVRRAQVILFLNKGQDPESFKQFTGFSRSRTFAIRKNYLKKGLDSLKDHREGKPKEILTKKQREEVIETVKNKTPEEIGMVGKYWSTTILSNYIFRTYKVKYKSKTSIYIIFKKSEFSFHKPGKVYEKHNEEQTQLWKKQVKPLLNKALLEKQTIVLCEDEMILSSQTTFQKIWLPKGEYPKIEVSNTKVNKSFYGFLNIKTGKEYIWESDKQTMCITKSILMKLRKIYPKKEYKLLIFWDGAGWHRGSVAQDFIKKDGNIEIIYFPPYSPEENPQEHIWKKGREQITHNKFIKNINEISKEFVNYLRKTKFHYNFLEANPVL